jgi:predicted metal-dependent peptidase
VRLRIADPIGREWLASIIYMLLEDDEYGEHAFAFTLHNIDVFVVKQPFAFYGELPVAAGVGLTKDLQIALMLYYPLISRLSPQSQIVVLKHELFHIIEGHMSSYGARLTEEYGKEISNIAKDLYVNQRFSDTEIRQLTDDGLPPCTIAKFGLPPKLSSEDYCRLLQDKASSGEIKLPKQQDLTIVSDQNGSGSSPQGSDSQAGTSGQPGDDFNGKGQYRPSEVFDLDKTDASQADQATREVINRVTSALEAEKKSWDKTRGFQGADHEQFIEAATRRSSVPWYYYIRVMESKNRAEVVVPTRRRLSRRCPSHMGRVRRYGLDVVFMIDTSGSMGVEQLELVDAELRGLHGRGAHIKIIHCDAHVARVEDYSPFTPMEKFHGRGGTDFSPALLLVRDMYPRPGLFVGFTDGFGGIEQYVNAVKQQFGAGWYDQFTDGSRTSTPDGIEAIWLIPEGCMNPDEFKERVVPWGHVIVVPAADAKETPKGN